MIAPDLVPRPEHPRPQFSRDTWLNLNGMWEFEVDSGDSGIERGILDRDLKGRILVPFAPESEASGIGEVDHLGAVWYRHQVCIPSSWNGKRLLLHFGAVDHDATVWVNGAEVIRHRGGFTPFTADLGVRADGELLSIVVRARDGKDGIQARGKQSAAYANSGCNYTRTTGIWQTVWLEAVPASAHLRRVRITPHLGDASFQVSVAVSRNLPGSTLRVTLSDDCGQVGVVATRADLDLTPSVHLVLSADRVRPWCPHDPHLYEVLLELLDADGVVIDTVHSYAGLRSVAIDGRRILINGVPVFQRLVLDQGYYPQTLMTAPEDQALVRDIQLSLDAGFNGARLHEKVFEERYLYHADRMGYLVWGEFGDWANLPGRRNRHSTSFLTQWLEVLERDYSHPSIIGWCPLNETREQITDEIDELDDITRGMFLATKQADQTRPVLDASGYAHRVPESDVYDSHDYTQDPAEFAAVMAPLAEGKPPTNLDWENQATISIGYRGQPYFCSEFGGIWWNPQDATSEGDDNTTSWGYGQRPASEEEFYRRFRGLTQVLLDDENMFGYCYTQLTDVFQEQNGIYRFDRSVKLDIAQVREAQTRMASIERTNRTDLLARS